MPQAPISKLAVAAFLASLLVCVPGAGVLALVLGWLAHRRMNEARGRLRGEGFVAAAVALGLLGTVGQLLAVFVWSSTLEFFDELEAASSTLAVVEVDLETGARRILDDGPGEDTCPAWLGPDDL